MSEHCLHASSLILHNDNSSLITPTAQVRKLKPGKLEHLVQSQQAFQPPSYLKNHQGATLLFLLAVKF